MEDAALMDALWPKPMSEINDMDETLLKHLILYRAVKDVAQNGGTLNL
jgi:hypothetical protein